LRSLEENSSSLTRVLVKGKDKPDASVAIDQQFVWTT